MFKIDIHTHIIPKTIPKFMDKFGYGGFIQMDHSCGKAKMLLDDGTLFRAVEPNCYDPIARLEECDAQGTNMQVLSTVPTMFCYWARPLDNLEVARFLNDQLAETVANFPRRFFGLGTVPLQDPELAAQELHRCVKKLGLRGAQIGSHIGPWNLDHPLLYPFYEEAEKLGAALFVHPWDMMGTDNMPKYWLPWLVGMPAETSRAICSMIFGGIFEKFPRLRVAFAHGGGSFPATIGRIERGFNVRPDLCAVDNNVNPKNYLGKFYLDTLVHDPTMLSYLISLVGETRLALGTDYPFPLGESPPGSMIEAMVAEGKITTKTQQQLFSLTALDWLGAKLTGATP